MFYFIRLSEEREKGEVSFVKMFYFVHLSEEREKGGCCWQIELDIQGYQVIPAHKDIRGYEGISETIRGHQLTSANCSHQNKIRHDQSLDKIRLVHIRGYQDIIGYQGISAVT